MFIYIFFLKLVDFDWTSQFKVGMDPALPSDRSPRSSRFDRCQFLPDIVVDPISVASIADSRSLMVNNEHCITMKRVPIIPLPI